MVYKLTDNGMICELYDDNISHKIESDSILIYTDKKIYDLSEMDFTKKDNIFVFSDNTAEFILEYNRVEKTSFITRGLKIKFSEETALLKIAVTDDGFEEMFMYDTFYNASAAVFARSGKTGVCFGFENPFCELEDNLLSFEPSLILKSEETFECDLNFYGLYPLSGELIKPKLNKSELFVNGRSHPRYRNPSEGTALYFSEIHEFVKYTNNYFDCANKKFRFTSYNFFGNLPQRPETEAERDAYLRHIDNFTEMGGDTIVLNPLYPNKIPTADENSYWELFPENTYAKEIYDYAESKGLRIGMYTGTAVNGRYGNSSMISYSDNKAWKKLDIHNNISEENCLASDDFIEWFIKVQSNTIEKYKLDIWSWDPGPGNGMFCFDGNHGHLPGKGQYKGFRNSLKIMKALKDKFPDLYYVGFHGNKEYGLWGFKYIDQHEAYWENEVYVMTPVFPDLSVDRATADGIRLQSIWNYYFRFMPVALNHGLAHRMVQACWMQMLDLDTLFDYCGWKYALLSAIAAGGSVTLPIIPRNPHGIDEYVPFYKKWITWARDNFEYSKNTIPFGEQAGCGVEGFAKIIDNEGYIFLVNSFCTPLNFSFKFNGRIGFDEFKKPLYCEMIYPYCENKGSYGFNDEIKIVVPGYEVLVFKVSFEEIGEVSVMPREPLPRNLTLKNNRCTFYADTLIREALENHKKYNSVCAENICKEYSVRFNRLNNCWTRADRLWLWVFPENSDNVRIFVNDREIMLQTNTMQHNELCVRNGYFADITDYIVWGEDNIILTDADDCDLYLYYPKIQNERIPETAENTDIPKGTSLCRDDSIIITSASINNDNIIYPDKENALTATVNLSFEETEGVYASMPVSIGDTGYNLKHDMALEYEDGVWRRKFKSGSRLGLIIDDSKICLWAVTKDGRVGKTYKLPVNWELI